jgi:hypothetical protein
MKFHVPLALARLLLHLEPVFRRGESRAVLILPRQGFGQSGERP